MIIADLMPPCPSSTQPNSRPDEVVRVSGLGRGHVAAVIGILEAGRSPYSRVRQSKILELMIIIQDIFPPFAMDIPLQFFDTDHLCLCSTGLTQQLWGCSNPAPSKETSS